ncbi:MAG: hypothetical protein M3Z32_08765 [Acidobacteriota bacterium]|nr:hypothetical protein [Acidobacteriota bacterium]
MKQFQCICVFGVIFTAALQCQAQVTAFNPFPSRIIGQPVLQQQTQTATAPNLVEGRELNSPQGVAVDTSSSPPILYVADTGNNRVLAWKNPAGLNKGDRADKVIGQRDFLSVAPKGPGSDLSTGLSIPLALAVDKSGNLYVADAGNNRILRFPSPLTQTSDLLPVDLIIGQANISSRAANQGLAAPTEKTLAFSSGGSTSRTGLAFDPQGNLWVSDPFNGRVLRFPASSLVAGQNGPAADIVLGQFDFVSASRPASTPQNGKTFLVNPSGLAFDPQGRLYVADNLNRVLVYTSLFTGAPATRILGVILPTQQVPTPPALNDTTLGSTVNGTVNPPESIFFVGNNPFVVDRGNARILKFDPFDQFPAETTTFSPKAIAVVGQPNFISNRSNQGLSQPSAQTFSGPVQARTQIESTGIVSAVFAGNDLYVVDSGNNRVLIFPQQSGGTFGAATRVLGQLDFQYNSINLIEGREFFFQGAGGSAIIDTQSNPPHLYVSDPPNNRVLGFRDYRNVKPGDRADLVIGQPSFFTGLINYPSNDPNQISDQGLSFPEGLAIDARGDLWVADFGNARVLRFPKPFDQPQGGPVQRANLVIGQQSFFTKVTDASSQTMSAPYGIVFTATGHLLVSDRALNRVLFFLKTSTADFVNGQGAYSVIGQPDFGPHTSGSLSNPSLIAVDSDDRLYVADTGNNRIAVYRNVPTAGNDPAPSFSLTSANAGSIVSPTGVFASLATGEIWVANTGANTVLRFPRFDALVTKTTPNVTLGSAGPLAVALDPFDNPVVVESTNRVAFYFPLFDLSTAAGGVPGRFSGNAANYLQRFAPGMLASIFSFTTTRFGNATEVISSTPAPTVLGDVSVLVGGVAAPLLYASPGQINFLVPSSTPVGSSGQEIQVIRASTGQVLASALVRIESVSPGLFTNDSSGSGQLAALNQDNTRNDGGHPAKAGSIIQLFGTGQGIVSGAPADGSPAALTQLPTDEKPKVYINSISGPVPDEDVLYSGLAPGFIGLWQINVKIPKDVPIGDVAVAVIYKGINSRADQFGNARSTTIRTTP